MHLASMVSVAVDVALLTVKDRALEVLLIERNEQPFKGMFQIPGGFVRPDESLDDAARRLLHDKAGVSGVFFEQLYTFGDIDRDPRTRVITVAHYALLPPERLVPKHEGSVLAKIHVPWEGEAGGPVRATDPSGKRLALAFDHADILGLCVKRLRGKLSYAPIGFQLLPRKFTLRQLQDVHQAVLGRALNKDSFRRTMLASGQLAKTGEIEESVGHRPAELYRFTKRSAV